MRMCIVLPVLLVLVVQPLLADNLDELLYRKIHDGWKSALMDDFMSGISRVGSRETGLVVCLGLSVLGDEKRREAGKLAAASLLGGQAVCGILKLVVNRDRPEGESSRTDSSFPSGHAAAAFSLAYVLGKEYRRLELPLHILAGLVGVSRVYLGRHYPSDVLAGAVIGCGSGWLVLKNRSVILSFHL